MRFWLRIRDWLLLGGVLTAAFGLMISSNDPLLYGLRKASLGLTGAVEERIAWAGHFLRAQSENRTLRRENVELSSQVLLLREARMENERMAAALGFQQDAPYEMVAARVIAKDIFALHNFLTLDVGQSSGIEIDMPVVTERGIVGRVVAVTERYCRVMPFLNTEFYVPAKILPNLAVGMINWPGTSSDYLDLDGVVKTEPVEIGQTVVTSRESGIFPPGFTVGTIASVATSPGENAYAITVAPAVSLPATQHAFVLLHSVDPERTGLEELSLP